MIGSHARARKKKREPKGQRLTRRCGIRMDGWKLSGIPRKQEGAATYSVFCTSTAVVAATTAATLPLRYCIVQSRSEREAQARY
uniref:Uncharacterized protein n=1 Tax=Trichogramma kaykai TaxID=54128 RepID=A0ABD2XEP0_9HYME